MKLIMKEKKKMKDFGRNNFRKKYYSHILILPLNYTIYNIQYFLYLMKKVLYV